MKKKTYIRRPVKKYTNPVICDHNNDLKKDWYVYFEYKHDGKKYKFKKREGVNRIKDLNERIEDIKALRDQLERDLFFGWSPLQNPKRTNVENPFYLKTNPYQKSEPTTFEQRMTKAFKKYYYMNKPQ